MDTKLSIFGVIVFIDRCKMIGEKIGSIRTYLLEKIPDNKTLVNQCSRQNILALQESYITSNKIELTSCYR